MQGVASVAAGDDEDLPEGNILAVHQPRGILASGRSSSPSRVFQQVIIADFSTVPLTNQRTPSEQEEVANAAPEKRVHETLVRNCARLLSAGCRLAVDKAGQGAPFLGRGRV